ncbi:MAG: M17 family peptidase N-terminal domain-containing protein, partial [Microvirga sp.]
MAASVKIDFQPFGAPAGGDLVVFVGDDLKPADAALEIDPKIKDVIAGAAGPERFKGKPGTALTIPAPAGLSAERLIAVGIGGETDRGKLVYADLGAAVAGKLAGRSGMVMAALPGLAPAAEDIAQMALGARLRLYRFDRYKTKKKEDDENGGTTRITFAVADPVAARKAAKAADGLAEGVGIARDLVNEPPNVLGPEEFANRAAALAKLGVEVEVLDEKALRKLGMRALLAVGQGSARESRVVLMRWNGGKA